MSKTVSVRVEPIGGRKAAGQRRHDLRDPKHIPDYVDRTRTPDNSIILEPPDPSTLRAEIEGNRRAAGQQKLRADARTTVRGIITFGTEAQPYIDSLSRDAQNNLYRRIAANISKETGHQLIGLVVHRDESGPHAHFLLRGYRRDEQGREHPWRHGRQMMSRLQDIAAQDLALRVGGITRGTPKVERIARGDDAAKIVHRTVHELHRDLPAEVEARRRKLEELERERQELEAKAEKNRRLVEEQEEKLRQGRVSEEQAQKRIQTYQRRADDASQRLEDIQKRIREAEEAERTAAATVELPPAPPPPTPMIVEVVTGRGVLGRPQTVTMAMVHADEVRNFSERWQRRDNAQGRAIGKALGRADAAEKAAALEKQKTRTLGAVLEAVRNSPVATVVAQTVDLFREWMKSREKQQQRQHGHGIQI